MAFSRSSRVRPWNIESEYPGYDEYRRGAKCLWGRGDAGQRRDCSKSLAIRRHCVGGTAGHFSPAPDLVHLGPAAQPKAAPKSEKGELKDAGLASIGSNLPGMYPVRPV